MAGPHLPLPQRAWAATASAPASIVETSRELAGGLPLLPRAPLETAAAVLSALYLARCLRRLASGGLGHCPLATSSPGRDLTDTLRRVQGCVRRSWALASCTPHFPVLPAAQRRVGCGVGGAVTVRAARERARAPGDTEERSGAVQTSQSPG